MNAASGHQKQKPVIGIIGGIGSGKSLVAGVFAELDGYLISGDELGHEALQQPEIRSRIAKRWGNELLREDGEIDRTRLGRIVFADSGELRELEKMVFPHIERRILEEADRAGKSGGYNFIVLDAAVMCEAGWDRWCDHVIFVHADPEVRYQRLAENRNWTLEEIQRRENAQMSLEEKRRRSSAVIDNGTSLDRMRDQVNQLAQQWNLVPKKDNQ